MGGDSLWDRTLQSFPHLQYYLAVLIAGNFGWVPLLKVECRCLYGNSRWGFFWLSCQGGEAGSQVVIWVQVVLFPFEAPLNLSELGHWLLFAYHGALSLGTSSAYKAFQTQVQTIWSQNIIKMLRFGACCSKLIVVNRMRATFKRCFSTQNIKGALACRI